MRIGLDYTSAVVQRAGIGRYTRSLVEALSCRLPDADELLLWYAARTIAESRSAAPRTMERRLPIDARWTTLLWQRLRLPLPINWLMGPVDVLHFPDFVAPPARAPFVVTIHDLSYLVAPQYAHPSLVSYLGDAVPRTLRRAAAVVAVSESTRLDLIQHYRLPPERVVTIYNGVDREVFQIDGTERDTILDRLSLTRPYFLTVGTIEPRKNHLGLLEGFNELAASNPNVSLVIVGRPGWLAGPIVAEIEKAATKRSIHHLTSIDDRTLGALYAGAIALVYPSWYEGFGLPVVEAMACGLPIVTSNQGALPEIAGGQALLVAPDRPSELAAAMRRLLDDRELRQSLAASGLERAREFTWDNCADQHLQLYRTIGGRT